MSDPKPISFAAEEEADAVYRGVTAVANANMAQNSLELNTSQQSGKAASVEQQTRNFGGKCNEIITLETDAAGFKAKSQIQQNEPQNRFVLQVVHSYNEISSFNVTQQTPAQVVTSLAAVLNDYPSDIAFEAKPDSGTIEDGVVFVNNFYSVFFTIWTAKDGDDTRFEFRRSSGDALAAAKFLGDIKARLFGDKESSENEAGGSMLAMDMDTSGLEELKTNDEQKERMMIHEALIGDDVVQDSLEENAENYLLGKMVERKAIVIGQDKIEHDKLCDTLLDRSVLLHGDLSVVRAALLMLAKLVAEGFEAKMVNKATFEAFKEVVETQKCAIVKGYVLALLKLLSEKSGDAMKSVDEGAREALKKQLKTFEEGCDKKKYSGFEKVYETL